MATAVPHTGGQAEGERLKAEGMARAAERRQRMIWRGQLALLDAIRTSPCRQATTDDATADIATQYADGGKWRGTVPRDLARAGLIRKAGVVASVRPSRHAGYLSKWQGIDDQAIDAYRAQLRQLLAVQSPPANATQLTLFPIPN
jgi:hypothetical protein